jgi:proline dehydrogenase
MNPHSPLSFDDTEVAFAYKSDAELRRANLIFTLVNHPRISSLATGAVNLALRAHLPIDGIIRRTAFAHFCGGESIDDSEEVIHRLHQYGVSTILDYSVEGEKSETGFEDSMAEILRTLDKARTSSAIPFCVFKVTGLAASDLLEKIASGDTLSESEVAAFDRVRGRVETICEKAHGYGVPVLVDAEESWIQRPIDQLVDDMMARYNRERAIVYNTYQLYRVETLERLRRDITLADQAGYFLGAKLVRGAYMEKERERASKLGYPSPIHPTRKATDEAFNQALALCVSNLDRVYFMCGSHNEYSNGLLIRYMEERDLDPNDERIWFAQLYGMSDNISFNLARAGYNVAKYVPYGPVRAVMPYLFRRAEENTSVAGQSSRELLLIREELKRRRRR